MKKTKESQEIKAYIYIEEKRQRNAMQKKPERNKKEGRKKKAMVKECSSCMNYFDQE